MAILDSTVINGNLNVTGNIYGSNIYASSDRNLKENIKDVNINFLDLVSQLEIKSYNYINDEDKRKIIGIIAQDLLELLPEEQKGVFISQLDDEHLVVNTTSMLYLAIGAIQEQQKQIDELREEIEKLKK